MKVSETKARHFSDLDHVYKLRVGVSGSAIEFDSTDLIT